jgi:hypothetical protein
MIDRKKRREMRAFADRSARRFMTLRLNPTEDEVVAQVREEMKKEYGMDPATMIVIAKIILELVKAWREARTK